MRIEFGMFPQRSFSWCVFTALFTEITNYIHPVIRSTAQNRIGHFVVGTYYLKEPHKIVEKTVFKGRRVTGCIGKVELQAHHHSSKEDISSRSNKCWPAYTLRCRVRIRSWSLRLSGLSVDVGRSRWTSLCARPRFISA